MLRPLRIAITSGDAHGIGPEVVAKALNKIGPRKNVQFLLWRNSEFPKRDLQRIKKEFKLISTNSWAEALTKMPSSNKELVDICLNSNPATWVEEAASACFFKHLDGLATAPLSKPTIKASGLKDIGHTDILKRISKTQNVYMTFLGSEFNVMLATGHCPISQVSSKLSAHSIETAVLSATRFIKTLHHLGVKNIIKKPLGVLGLNPHAGDAGLIGNEEFEFIQPVLERLKEQKVALEGPLVPDSAFTPNHWARYSLYLALYHDQGLIPFKTVHGQKGVHVTWGLPFVRTSVDHGTAFDIAGLDKADATSMRLAIEWALKLSSGLAREVIE
ncbi:MAG: 4-hydroxythreonine-4-phosphate dehydrogenase PdxA [Oligoflexia bacterium]|nr:4-hydroxythreonine-4-phosphate dehydrogenase PdxA [Oligoflexia bacterium]